MSSREFVFDRSFELAERILYILLCGAFVSFAVYVYILPFFPAFKFIKDFLFISIGIISLINLRRKSFSFHPGMVDLFVFIFGVYLIFHLIYTALHIKSLMVAYLGLRLNFLPILSYFGFRSLRSERYKRNCFSLFVLIMLIAVIFTLIEFFLFTYNLVPQDFFCNLSGACSVRDNQTLGYFQRIYGLMGSPHNSGIFHMCFLAVLLFSSERSNNNPWPKYLYRRHIRTLLLFLTVSAIFISTSKTSWIIFFVIMGLMIIRERRINMERIMLLILGVFFLYLMAFQTPGQTERVVNQLILGTFKIKTEQVVSFFNGFTKKNPIIGNGYSYINSYQYNAPNLPKENMVVTGDFFFIDLLHMIGLIGVIILSILLIFFPSRTFFLEQYSLSQKSSALGVLSIAMQFLHYSPLANPLIGITIWYLVSNLAEK